MCSFEDLFRGLGDLLDVHAALGAGHHQRTRIRAVQQDGKVELALDLLGARDEQGPHHAALGPRLLRDERLAEHVARDVDGLLDGLHQFDAALESVGERALPRPPAWICDFTTRSFCPAAKSFSAMAFASAMVWQDSPEGRRRRIVSATAWPGTRGCSRKSVQLVQRGHHRKARDVQEMCQMSAPPPQDGGRRWR